MTRGTEDRPTADGWDAVLDVYAAHLELERGLSPHTVRAYLTDLTDLATHARLAHIDDPARLDLRTLRGWLAGQQTRGRSRTTVARRATSVRVFTGWLLRTGRASSDAGALLATPKRQRALPATLRAEQVREVLDAAAAAALEEGPVGARDVAALELLYATGIRVGELVGLDVDDVDHERHLVRVLGKGSKERSVPYGRPAAAALVGWLDRPGRSWRPPAVARRCSSVRAAAGSTPARCAGWCTAGWGRAATGRTSVRTGCATRPRPTCSKAAPTCARCRSCSATPRSRPRRSTPTSAPSGCVAPIGWRTPAPDRPSCDGRGVTRG